MASPRPLAAVVAVALAACATPTPTPTSTSTSTANPRRPEMAEILAASRPDDWAPLDPERTVVLELPAGRVVILLAPAFAPVHAARILALVRAGYFDGLAVIRVQDGYVSQWGDPDSDDPAKARAAPPLSAPLPPEFTRPAAGVPFTRLPDGDVYAPEAGFSDGFPAARDPATGEAWLAHCYGAVGVARGEDPASGDGTSLYVVIGHAPRGLDRNIAVVGRVVQGMEHLASLPRGPGAMGFFEDRARMAPIRAARVAADLPVAERPALEVLRTDTPTFERLVESRRNRGGPWYVRPAGKIDLCNVPLPVRARGTAP